MNRPTRPTQPAPTPGTFPLGRVRGVLLQLHWSIFPAFGLFAYTLATGVFQERLSEGQPDVAWLLGLVAAALLLGSILLHELGHAVVAQRNGLEVNTITLFFFGGVAQVEDEPRSAGVEFRVAVAGPLVTLALGVLLFFAMVQLPNDGLLDGGASWLLRTQILILLFNLVPGYPLDGGRILRSIVWAITGNEAQATKIAVRGGQAVAIMIAAVGIGIIVIGNQLFGGLWLLMIAWFLQNTATATGAHVVTRAVLESMTAAQAMAREIVYVPSRTRVEDLLERTGMVNPRQAYVVVDDDPLGVISPIQLVVLPRERWPWTVVTQVMTPWRQLARITPETNLFMALQRMDEERAFFALVLDSGGGIAGVLSRDQIIRSVRTAKR